MSLENNKTIDLDDPEEDEDLSWMLEAENAILIDSRGDTSPCSSKQENSPVSKSLDFKTKPEPLAEKELENNASSQKCEVFTDANSPTSPKSLPKKYINENPDHLLDKWQILKQRKEKNQETLRKLRLVEQHRQKVYTDRKSKQLIAVVRLF